MFVNVIALALFSCIWCDGTLWSAQVLADNSEEGWLSPTTPHMINSNKNLTALSNMFFSQMQNYRASHRTRATFSHMAEAIPKWQAYRWEGDSTSRPLGQMERLLNARRSWNGAMTTPHVAAAILEGPPPRESELLEALEWVLQRHPLLASCVRGKSNHYIPDAKPYPMHSNYLDRAFYYGEELFKPEPNKDIQRFEPSGLSHSELAKRALRLMRVANDVMNESWQAGFDEAMDTTTFDEDAEGPLWRITLYTNEDSLKSALVYQANHAISDQLSFNLILSEVLANIASSRKGKTLELPDSLPLPPSVEGALLGTEQRQSEEIKSRLELIIGSFVDGMKIPTQLGEMKRPTWAPKSLPAWKFGRVRPATVAYGLWQAAASGARVLPRWVPNPKDIEGEGDSKWEHRARRTKSIFRAIDADTLAKLLDSCRARGTSVGAALCSAALLGSSDVMGVDDQAEPGTTQRYKLLQALDMRTLAFEGGGMKKPGARDDWSSGTVLAGTGSLDILIDLPPGAGKSARDGSLDLFWSTAADCKKQTTKWISSGWGRESLLLFASGWEFMNMNRVVELGSQDRETMGRAFSAGISNVGKFLHATQHGDLQIKELFFGISQSVSAPSISTSAVTVDGVLYLTFTYATPIWTTEAAEEYANHFVELLQLAAAQ